MAANRSGSTAIDSFTLIDHRYCDARLYTPQDYNVAPSSILGTGWLPMQQYVATEAPRGFEPVATVNGIGGQLAPITGPTPLLDEPSVALSFLLDQPNA
jgi:hypothetical protein